MSSNTLKRKTSTIETLRCVQRVKISPGTNLAAEILTKAGEALLVEAQQWEDLEKPLHLREVDRCHGLIELLCNYTLQFLLCLLQQDQTGVHGTACADTVDWESGLRLATTIKSLIDEENKRSSHINAMFYRKS